jgi:hypothetical protein
MCSGYNVTTEKDQTGWGKMQQCDSRSRAKTKFNKAKEVKSNEHER